MSTVADELVVSDEQTETPADDAVVETPPAGETEPESVPTETPPQGDEPPPPEPPASEEPPAEDSSKWITDEHREIAASYGLSDGDLGGFASEGEFYRACRLADRTSRGQESESTSPPAETPESKPATPTPEPSTDDDLTLDLSKYSEYDAETLQVVKVAKHLQEQNRAMQQELARLSQERFEQAWDVERDRFHEVLDGMDAALFGGQGDLGADDSELNKRRAAVWEAYLRLRQSPAMTQARTSSQRSHVARGLVRRAALATFGDEMLKSQKKEIHRQIQDQAKQRRPSPSRGKSGPTVAPTHQEPKSIREAAKELVSTPEIAALFDRHEEESGNVPS